MCTNKRPNPKNFFTNLRGPNPAVKKLKLLIKNNMIKITSMKSCCGNVGEPGC